MRCGDRSTIVVHERFVERREVEPSPRGAHDDQRRYHDREEAELRGLHELVLARQCEHRWNHCKHPQDQRAAGQEVVKEDSRRGRPTDRHRAHSERWRWKNPQMTTTNSVPNRITIVST
jgi:hypothetical protein